MRKCTPIERVMDNYQRFLFMLGKADATNVLYGFVFDKDERQHTYADAYEQALKDVRPIVAELVEDALSSMDAREKMSDTEDAYAKGRNYAEYIVAREHHYFI